MRILLLTFSLLLVICSVGYATEKILYSHLTDDHWQVWMMDADGSNNEQVTFSLSDKRDPTWMRGQNELTPI